MDALLLSDRIRQAYIKQGSKLVHEPTRGELLEADDWVLISSFPGGLQYNEYWGETCWQALYKKPVYRDLPRRAAIDKFMRERFPQLAEGYEIISYSFINAILRVQLRSNC